MGNTLNKKMEKNVNISKMPTTKTLKNTSDVHNLKPTTDYQDEEYDEWVQCESTNTSTTQLRGCRKWRKIPKNDIEFYNFIKLGGKGTTFSCNMMRGMSCTMPCEYCIMLKTATNRHRLYPCTCYEARVIK